MEGIVAGKMVKHTEQGDDTRRAILRALLDAGDERLTTRRLARRVGLSHAAIGYQVQHLTNAGLVYVRRGRTGGVFLTEAGIMAARAIPD